MAATTTTTTATTTVTTATARYGDNAAKHSETWADCQARDR
jgi:hypothetical protein